ncbi:MAG: zinc-binding dehydrogenase [Rubrobacter sp.]|nr:zinc-binding dehydrogenase [Rubrobacter sp.]
MNKDEARENPATLEARAVWFDAPRSAELRPETVPLPQPGEVRIKAAFSAISHGTEMLVYRGEVSENLPLDLPTLSGGYDFPIKFGYAAVGKVMDVGRGVDGFAPGDAVFVHHPHQTVFTVPASMPMKLPDGLDPILGPFFANVETALNIVLDSPIKLGETAVVFGQGVVGLLVSQLLRDAGAKVVAVEPLAGRRDLAVKLGADVVVEPGEDAAKAITDATDGRGADAAFEVSGTGAALQSAIECVAPEGTVVAASWHGAKPVSLDLGGRFHRGRVRIKSSQVGNISPELGARWSRSRRTKAVLELLPKLELRELITHRIPFDDAPEAYRLLDQKPGEAVQFVFEYGEAGYGENEEA